MSNNSARGYAWLTPAQVLLGAANFVEQVEYARAEDRLPEWPTSSAS